MQTKKGDFIFCIHSFLELVHRPASLPNVLRQGVFIIFGRQPLFFLDGDQLGDGLVPCAGGHAALKHMLLLCEGLRRINGRALAYTSRRLVAFLQSNSKHACGIDRFPCPFHRSGFSVPFNASITEAETELK